MSQLSFEVTVPTYIPTSSVWLPGDPYPCQQLVLLGYRNCNLKLQHFCARRQLSGRDGLFPPGHLTGEPGPETLPKRWALGLTSCWILTLGQSTELRKQTLLWMCSHHRRQSIIECETWKHPKAKSFILYLRGLRPRKVQGLDKFSELISARTCLQGSWFLLQGLKMFVLVI